MQQDNFGTKTDEEIYQAAIEEWLGVLAKLWVAFDIPLEPVRLVIYQNALNLPLGLLELAVDRAIRDHHYKSVPIISEVWDALRAELGNPYDLNQAIEQWKTRKFEICIYRFDAVPAEAEAV